MGGRATLHATLRCDRCRLMRRWCVCAGEERVRVPLAVDVLMHPREAVRPTSTGRLIGRVVEGARLCVFSQGRTPEPWARESTGRERWILHPQGEPVPAGAEPAHVQVVLLDGSWREAGHLSRAVAGWGRKVALPMSGPSRYWLRNQREEEGGFSTAEALAFLLDHLGLTEAAATLRRQLELHVVAGLLSRGQKPRAIAYLRESAFRSAWPDLLPRLDPELADAVATVPR